MDDNTWQPMLTHAIAAAQSGAEVLLRCWGRLVDIRDKGYSGDLVTEADRQSEVAISTYLQQHYPTHSLLGEEAGGPSPSSCEWLWVIDPLDGTTNYTHGYPVVAISLALLHHGQPVVGVVYNPFSSELFTATLGGGAFLNGQQLHISAVADLANSLLASGFPYDRRIHPVNNFAAFCYLTHLTQGVRRGGAASLDLAYVAAGRLDGYWERGIQAWDIAAGALLVQEAGGRVTDYALQPLDLFGGYILASNGHLHPLISRALHLAPTLPLSAFVADE